MSNQKTPTTPATDDSNKEDKTMTASPKTAAPQTATPQTKAELSKEAARIERELARNLARQETAIAAFNKRRANADTTDLNATGERIAKNEDEAGEVLAWTRDILNTPAMFPDIAGLVVGSLVFPAPTDKKGKALPNSIAHQHKSALRRLPFFVDIEARIAGEKAAEKLTPRLYSETADKRGKATRELDKVLKRFNRAIRAAYYLQRVDVLPSDIELDGDILTAKVSTLTVPTKAYGGTATGFFAPQHFYYAELVRLSDAIILADMPTLSQKVDKAKQTSRGRAAGSKNKAGTSKTASKAGTAQTPADVAKVGTPTVQAKAYGTEAKEFATTIRTFSDPVREAFVKDEGSRDLCFALVFALFGKGSILDFDALKGALIVEGNRRSVSVGTLIKKDENPTVDGKSAATGK